MLILAELNCGQKSLVSSPDLLPPVLAGVTFKVYLTTDTEHMALKDICKSTSILCVLYLMTLNSSFSDGIRLSFSFTFYFP